jgi:nucleoside 2-deoxyribosyltransferase
MSQTKIYLAGPTVFLKNGIEIAEKKKEIVQKHGMIGFFPLDSDVFADPDKGTSKEFGIKIAFGMFRMMDQCDTVIADLTPFRGISADIGTNLECGYMLGTGKMVNGYSNSGKNFFQRTCDYYDNKGLTEENGFVWSPDGIMVEDCDNFDNVMTPGAITKSGGIFICGDVPTGDEFKNLDHFEEVVRQLAHKRKGPTLSL